MCQKVEMEESQIKNTVWRVSEGQLTIIIPSMMDQTVGQKQSKNSLNNFEFNLQFYQFLIWKFRHHWCDEKITKKSAKSPTKKQTNARRNIRKCHLNDFLECHSLEHKHHLISDAMCKCRAVSQIALIIIIVKQMQHLHTVWLLTPFNLHKIVISIYWVVLEMTENTSWFNYIAL